MLHHHHAMARNIEIKAHAPEPQELLARVLALEPHHHELIAQDDTFFRSTTGRLKLRDFGTGQGQLIYYERPDQAGPKASFYVCTPTSDPDGLRQALTLAHGQVGRCQRRFKTDPLSDAGVGVKVTHLGSRYISSLS